MSCLIIFIKWHVTIPLDLGRETDSEAGKTGWTFVESMMHGGEFHSGYRGSNRHVYIVDANMPMGF
ncbi:MAG TPA: hypothetical protein DCZ40_02875 [Lachnospiraceae bacterium]|nr:hypothetical protein [Lachnospiraceae bacterium]